MKRFFYFALLLLTMVGTSCEDAARKAKRAAIRMEIEEAKKQMPIEAPNMTITDVNVKEDMVVYQCVVEDPSQMIQEDSVMNNDKNIARTIASLDERFVASFIEAEMGLKYIYASKEGEELASLAIPAAKMKSVSEKIKSGEIQPYSILEMSQIEIEQTSFPMQIGENLWMTDGCIKDNYIIYEIKIEANVEKSDITEEDWEMTKMNTVSGLKESPLITSGLKEIRDKEIHFSYVYKDVRDTVLSIIDITYDDLAY